MSPQVALKGPGNPNSLYGYLLVHQYRTRTADVLQVTLSLFVMASREV